MTSRNAPKRATRKLPWRQFTILATVRFAEPIAMTSVFPYLPSMIESFPRVKTEDIGFWTGTAAAMFSIAQCLTAISWGRASDRYGRKPILLIGLFTTMCTSLLWGLSTNLPMALLARALQGAGSGNVGILRTVVAEICPWKELQPRAFSIMPMVYSLGSVIGPTIGTTANPLSRQVGESALKYNTLLWKFPYLLPNLICSLVFVLGILIGGLFLNESLESKKHKPDAGIILGRKILGAMNSIKAWGRRMSTGETAYTPLQPLPTTVISKGVKDIETGNGQVEVIEGPPSYSSVLTSQIILYLAVYTTLAMHNTGFDQMIPVLMHHPRSGPLVGKTQLPFRFSKGFGMDTHKIGMLFTVNGCVGTFVQFLVFPRVARYLGTLNCLRLVLHVQTLVYVATPYTTLIEDETRALTAFFCIWIVKSACSIMAFPCCTILLTNSATSLRTLATVNGIATSVSAIGRAVGPSITGALFTWGVKNGLLISPFIALFIMAVAAFTPLYFASEGKGFGSDDEDEEHELSLDYTDASSSQTQSTVPQRSAPEVVREKSDYRSAKLADSRQERALLSDFDTHDPDGTAVTDLDDYSDYEDRRPTLEELRGTSGHTAVDAQFLTPEDGLLTAQQIASALPRLDSDRGRDKGKRRRRRSTTPLGHGVGFRRLSSNLGVTRSGHGSGLEL